MEGSFFIKTYICCVILIVISFICKWCEIFSLATLVRITELTLCIGLALFFCLSLLLLMAIVDSFHWSIFLFFSVFCLVIVCVVTLLFTTHIEISRLQNGKYALVKKAVFLRKNILSDCDSVVLHKIVSQAWRYDYKRVHVDWVEMFAYYQKHYWGLYYPDNESRCSGGKMIFPALFDSICLGERTIIQSPDTVRYNAFRLWFGGKYIERNYLGGIPQDTIEIRVDLTPDGAP